MQKKIRNFMKEHHMVEEGDCILAAVSGGADSICLLLILQELEQNRDIRLCAVHVEHGIRGEDSRKDARFVEEFCKQHRIPCKIFHCQAIAYAREHRMTVEEGARAMRYKFFAQAAEEFEADKIAVAHNQNDCAETMLFHLVRGTGLKGLCGIPPVRDKIIRPLLCVERREIEAYLEARNQPFCQDKTNKELDYTRNKIRLQILPALEEINPQAVAHMNQSAVFAAEAVQLMELLAEQKKGQYVRQTPQGVYISEKIQEEIPILQKSLLHKILTETAGSSRDISSLHVQKLQELFGKQSGRRLDFPYGIIAERIYEDVLLKKQQRPPDGTDGKAAMLVGGTCGNLADVPDGTMEKASGEVDWEGEKSWILPPEGIVQIASRGFEIHTRLLMNHSQNEEIPKKIYTKWMDYDKIKGTLQLRTRREKDFLVISSQGERKKLKRFFIDEKIPKEEREHMLLLVDDVHVVWVLGSRISADVKVTENTERILEIQVYGGNIRE